MTLPARLLASLIGFAVLMASLGVSPLTAQSVIQDTYRLGANDEVAVTVFGPQNLDVKTRIKEDGTIAFPYLGSVMARGETARTLALNIARLLKAGGFYNQAVVSVDVTAYVSNTVTVSGNVTAPGIFPLDRPLTLAMVVARAGGARSDGADYAVLTRGNQPAVSILLDDVTNPGAGANQSIQAGDTIIVPKAPVVYVYGQVNSPGAVPIRSGMTIRQALVRAGGPTLAGSERKITLYRDEQKIKKVSLEMLVRPNDTLFIRERLF